MRNKFSVQLEMTGHRTDGNHGPGSNPSKLRTLATKKSRCWRNQAITLTENLAIQSRLMSCDWLLCANTSSHTPARSFVTQRCEEIDASGATRGQQRRDQADREKEDHNGKER